MIRRLRDRHRRMLPVIALLTAIALALALLTRHRTVSTIPGALRTHQEAR
jgi:hypothetical protein